MESNEIAEDVLRDLLDPQHPKLANRGRRKVTRAQFAALARARAIARDLDAPRKQLEKEAAENAGLRIVLEADEAG